MTIDSELTKLPGVVFSLSEKKVVVDQLLLLAEEVRVKFSPNRDRTGKTWILSEINGQTSFQISRRVVDNSCVPPVITTESAIVHSPEGLFNFKEIVESNGRNLREPQHLSDSPEAADRIARLIRSFP